MYIGLASKFLEVVYNISIFSSSKLTVEGAYIGCSFQHFMALHSILSVDYLRQSVHILLTSVLLVRNLKCILPIDNSPLQMVNPCFANKT